MKRLLHALDTAIQAFGLLCLPLVLLASLTVWFWFPLLCVICGVIAGGANATR